MSSDSVTTGTADTATDHVVAGVDIGDADLAAALRGRLDEVEKLLVSRLESGEVPLDQSIALYERGEENDA